MALIDHLDHLVLTCVDPDRTKHFYTEVLQMQLETFGAGRLAFRFGNQKINLHVRGAEFEPKAHVPVPGALDLCFIASVPLDDVIAHLQRAACTTARYGGRCADAQISSAISIRFRSGSRT